MEICLLCQRNERNRNALLLKQQVNHAITQNKHYIMFRREQDICTVFSLYYEFTGNIQNWQCWHICISFYGDELIKILSYINYNVN